MATLTAGAKHAQHAHDAYVHKRAQKYMEQVRTLKMLSNMILKIMPAVGMAGGPQCVSNFLHSVLLKSSKKQKNITT